MECAIFRYYISITMDPILVQNPYPLLTFLVHALISMGSGNLMVEMQLHSVRAGHTAHTHSKAAPPATIYITVKASIQPLRNNPELTKQGPINSDGGNWHDDFTSSLQVQCTKVPSACLPVLLPLTDNLALNLMQSLFSFNQLYFSAFLLLFHISFACSPVNKGSFHFVVDLT